MSRFRFPPLLLFLSLVAWQPALAFPPAGDPALAPRRRHSHGGSRRASASMEGRSWVWSCAHLSTDEQGRPSAAERAKPLRIDGPVQAFAPKKRAEARLIAYDYDLDLSLIEIDNGPFQYVPVA